MTPQLQAAIKQLVGAAQTADVNLNLIYDDGRTPFWIRRIVQREARALAAAAKLIEEELLTEETT